MGDRANIIVKTGDEQVCLYSHWGGTELPEVLKKAMVRGKSRWDDPQYLARIIFCEMVREDIENTTGFGLSQTPGDGQGRILTVNINDQTVQVNKATPVSFSAFVKNPAPSWGSD